MNRAMKILAVLAVASLVGCANTANRPLYHWEGYQRQVYEFLNGDGTTESEQLTVMQEQVEKARAKDAALPPGFRAHLAMVHIRLGNYDEARQLIEAEKAAFPESTQYMDFVLKSMGAKKS